MGNIKETVMRTAIATDSNSGITQEQAAKLGIYVLPMPFMINGEMFYEGVNLTHEEFFKRISLLPSLPQVR